MMEQKEKILEELKEKTKDKGPWAKVIWAFGNFIFSFFEVILSFFKLILVIVFEFAKLGVKISLFFLFLLFSLFFTGFVSRVNSSDILQQISLFNPIIILSASLAALTMTFYSIIKTEEIDNEKKKTLRFASEGFFWSTLFYLIALMFAFLKKSVTFDFDIKFINVIVDKIPKEVFLKLIDIGLFLSILVATFYLTLQIYDILAHIGSFYEPKEEDSIRFQFKQFKRIFKNK